MGCWGTGLYSNDVAEDILDMCREIFPFLTVDEAIKMVLDEYKEILDDPEDDDYANFWYVFADYLWKHGVLTEEIKSHTLELLEKKAGMEIWYEDATKSDIKKRLAVLEKLQNQLLSEMPLPKIPKGRLSKPKFKPGDIVVFKTKSREALEYDWWTMDYADVTYIYSDQKISHSPRKLEKIIEAYDKYMAILCVGSTKEEHTQYLPDLYDEKSVYVYYDYMGDTEPTLEELSKCGFLPYTLGIWDETPQMNKIGNEWAYSFFLYTENFFAGEKKFVQEFWVHKQTKEHERYFELFNQKKYSNRTSLAINLREAYRMVWDSKAHMLSLGMGIDNLTDANAKNPELLQGEELEKSFDEYLKRKRAKGE